MRSSTRSMIGIAVAAIGLASLIAAVPAEMAESSPVSLDTDSTAVAETVNSFHKALSAGDSIAALGILAPDAVILESGGMETRSEYRSHHLPADISFARAVKSDRGPVSVTVAGSTAWTVGTSTTQGNFNGRAINSADAESMVLTRTASGWRIRSIHWSSRNRRPPSS